MDFRLKRVGLSGLVWMAIALTSCRNQPIASLHEPQVLPVTITLSGWQSNPNEKKLLDQVIRAFEAQNPTIKVKHEVINSEYMDVIKTRLIGDVAPDVFYLDAFEAPLLMKSNVLEPLNSYITPAFNLADFEPSMVRAFRHNGKLYGLPKDFSTLALIYNKKALAAANISQPPQTWDELLATSKRLTVDRDRDGKIDQYGFGIMPELARQAFVIKAFNGQLIGQNGYATFAESNSLKGLQLVIDQYHDDRTSAQPTDVGATSGSEMLGQGRVAMTIEGVWALPYFKETFPDIEFATAEVPTINGKAGTMAFTVAYVMNRKTQHKKAAWKLIAYLTGTKGMNAWARQGLALPTRRSVLASLGYDKKPLYAPFVRGAGYATIWQSGENLPTIRMNFNNQFVSALLGEQPLPQAMKKAQETANREIYLAN
ncbi:ABC transporter substrate-binding protein [Leptolyngbya sp. FACHB-321]|uniref:ABC transporter substrate-binding protein n=1 Tax=Leptolyngbya sp. FACHB-321 TaxID=2692807 RepID=UPI001682BA99|nr:ABC transporter substrate-binding protein [Leptolyngbya sp. FACHB-321]MBD2038563.1 ABC transporter substrate-binding protein [Leptolyngbya sp. FACHB-321]